VLDSDLIGSVAARGVDRVAKARERRVTLTLTLTPLGR
jgi:hypothetical protein